jgi:hypothetical protein
MVTVTKNMVQISNGRVIIDSAMFMKYNYDSSISLDPLDEPPPAEVEDPFYVWFELDKNHDSNSSLGHAPSPYQAIRVLVMDARRRAARTRNKVQS